jgi:hypothetical protein
LCFLEETETGKLRGETFDKEYWPQEYLVEGGNGRKHNSERSVQSVFERAVEEARIQNDGNLYPCQQASAGEDYQSVGQGFTSV